MHPLIPQLVGFFAVVLFLLRYQQKKRRSIIVFNVVSRLLYIVQYLLLGAFEGAVLDILGAISSVVATKKDAPWMKKHVRLAVLLLDGAIVVSGLLLYENPYSLLPIAGVLLHTTAFWMGDERIIRRVSLAGSPFWLVYNLHSRAYGSAVGDALTMVSILYAMFKYRHQKTKEDSTDV